MTKQDYIKENINLQNEIDGLKKESRKKLYEIKTPDGELVEILAHGYSSDYYRDGGHRYNFWIHPWENVADFINPVYVREK